MKVGSAPGARQGRGETGRRRAGVGSCEKDLTGHKAHPLPISEEPQAGLGGVSVSNSLPSKSREGWAES